jgi:hypothetical protein
MLPGLRRAETKESAITTPATPTPAPKAPTPVDKAPTPAPVKPAEKAPAPAEKPTGSQAKEVKPTTPYSGLHDRVQMISLNADGTAAQHHPELLGDYDASVAELQERFTQQESLVSGAALDTMQTNHAAILTALATEGH